MANVLKIKRGALASLSSAGVEAGELKVAKDKSWLFVGDGTNNNYLNVPIYTADTTTLTDREKIKGMLYCCTNDENKIKYYDGTDFIEIGKGTKILKILNLADGQCDIGYNDNVLTFDEVKNIINNYDVLLVKDGTDTDFKTPGVFFYGGNKENNSEILKFFGLGKIETQSFYNDLPYFEIYRAKNETKWTVKRINLVDDNSFTNTELKGTVKVLKNEDVVPSLTVDENGYIEAPKVIISTETETEEDDKWGASRRYVKDKISSLGKVMKFVGYVSDTQPSNIKSGEYWTTELKTEFPFTVKKYNGKDFENYEYTASDFEVWVNLGDNKEYYYCGGTINQVDFTIDPKELIDDITTNLTEDEKHIQVKDLGITKAKLAEEVVNDYSIDNDNSEFKLDMDTEGYPISLKLKTLDNDEVLTKSINGKDLLDKALIDDDNSTITLEQDETTSLKNVIKVSLKNKSGDVLLEKSLSLANLDIDCGEY